MEFMKASLRHITFILVVATILGCGQNYRLLDASSQKNTSPEYQDFSDLPMPAAPAEEDVTTEDKSASQTGSTDPKSDPKSPPSTQAPSKQNPAPTQSTKKTGVGIGTVYYLPVYGEKRNCPKGEFTYVKDENEKTLAKLCKDEVWNCAMQGSCFYVDDGGVTLFAYKKIIKLEVPGTKETISQPRFRPNKELTLCPQGMGAHRICLDPYRSIAADPKFHRIGDVVYVPLLKDKELPNGEIHDGYFIVRDTGGNIKGEGRFDFFIGFDSYRGHMFTKLGLATKKANQFTYHLVPDDIAQKVKLARRYPLAPKKVHDNAYASMIEVLGIKQTSSVLIETKMFYLMKQF